MAKNGLLAGTKRTSIFTGATVTDEGTQVSNTNPFPVNRRNSDGTEHQSPTLTISNAIDSTSFDLNAAAFSETTNISNDYIFDSVELNFSTNESKTITITSGDGTILLGGTVDTSSANLLRNTTKQNFNLVFKQAFNANDNITVTVTQFSSAGTMDCILKVQEGSSTLNGTPVLGAGNEIIGKVKITDGTDDVDIVVTNGFNALVSLAPGHVSTVNSTSTPLSADAMFTGTFEDITNFGVIVVTVNSSHVSATDGLMIEFSSDGVNVDSKDDFTIPASTGKTFSFQAANKFFRVNYTNGSTSQTHLRLQTVLKPYYVKPSSHRIKDEISAEDDAELVKAIITGQKPSGSFVNFQSTTKGNFKVSLEEFDGTFNNNPLPVSETAKTAFGDLRVAELSPVFQGSFEYTVDNTDLNENTVVNGGTVTQSEAMAVVRSTTTTASTALFQSKQHARYRSGLGGLMRFTALFTSPVSATEQYIGISDEVGSSVAFKNGFMIGYDGTTFGFHRFQNDTLTTVAQANWDDPLDGTGASGMTLDQTKINVFFIQFQYLGAGAIKLFIENDATGEMVLVNTVDYSNANITPSVHNPNFHHTMWVNNKATTDDIILKGSSYAYFVEGKTSIIESHQPQFATGEKQKTSVTTEVAIMTIRNKANYQSKTNFIDILVEALTGSIEAASPNNLGKVRIVKNATLGGTPSYSDINTSNSVIEVDTSGTTVTGGTELFSIPLAGKNDSTFQPMGIFRIILNSGDTLTIAGSSSNSSTINASMLWRELF